MVQETQSFRQVRTARCVTPYVMLVVCIALDDIMIVHVLRGLCPPLYSLGDIQKF